MQHPPRRGSTYPRPPPRTPPLPAKTTPRHANPDTSAPNSCRIPPPPRRRASRLPPPHAPPIKTARHARSLLNPASPVSYCHSSPRSLDHALLLDPAALPYASSWASEPDHRIPPQLLVALGEYLSSSSCSSPSSPAAAAAAVDHLDAECEADDEFMMYEFKVRRCARARSHDWTACPYAHPGEAARRRDPRRVAYSGEACPDFRRRPGGAACPRGNACPLAHGTFELWLHPSRYRTRPCRAGPACRRRVCFFAHAAAELRAKAGACAGEYSPLALSPKSTLTSLWESPPVSPVEGRVVRWVDEEDADAAEVEELMLAMRHLSFPNANLPSGTQQVLPPVTEDDGPDLGWVSDLVM